MPASIQDDLAGQQLAALARRLRDDPEFMASALAEYQAVERASDSALASYLHLDPSQLSRLALCRRPDTGSPSFGDQVRQIAAFAGADLTALAGLLRQVHALTTLRNLPGHEAPAASDSLVTRGLLAAARDREPGDDDQADAPAESEEGESQ